MVTEKNQEYLAAGLRQHMESLAHMIEDVERQELHEGAIEWRIRAVELGLRRLREAA